MNKDQITELGNLMKEETQLRETLKEKKAAFVKENEILTKSIDLTTAKVNNLKDTVREQALTSFKELNVKTLMGGIKIRESSKLHYEDEDAIKWARENMPVALKETLKKLPFEKYAKENELSFVRKEATTSVTFPKEITFEKDKWGLLE